MAVLSTPLLAHPPRAPRRLLPVLLAVLLLGCAESAEKLALAQCRDALDAEDWKAALGICEAIGTDEGNSLAATAALGRAGVKVSSLFIALEETDLAGLPLILHTFDVTRGSTAHTDVEKARLLLQNLQAPQPGDTFNLLIATDVMLAAVLRQNLNITVDAATRAITIPGITNLPSLDPSAPDYLAALNNAYAGAYYTTAPPVWDDLGSTPGLSSLSGIVAENAAAAAALSLTGSGLGALALGAALDNGTCALVADGLTTDGALAARDFPRRLNTSSATFLAEELRYTYLDATGAVDPTREWAGAFPLPSVLLNPDNLFIECNGDSATLGEFGLCMIAGSTAIAPNLPGADNTLDPAQTTLADGTPVTCDSGSGSGPCTTWPLLIIGGTPTPDEFAANASTALSDLADVLDAVARVDNEHVNPQNSGRHCLAGDGWVHAREYDAFVRSLAP